MRYFDLCGEWIMKGNGFDCKGTIPGSVCSFLLNNELVPDPHYRDNERLFFDLLENDYSFEKTFAYKKTNATTFLTCEGLDTLCDIYLNGALVAYTDNMHLKYEFDVSSLLVNGENHIKLVFHAVNPYIKERWQQENLRQSKEPMLGFAYIRKAHYMLGWDWGPMLPDMGIWRKIYLTEKDSARILDWKVKQRHCNNEVFITPIVETDKPIEIEVKAVAPNGDILVFPVNEETKIENPMLWWPNGLGEAYLYAFEINAIQNGIVVDSVSKKIGLRDMKLIREQDEWGVGYCHEVNGVRFFALGANYIPEDNILSRITVERSRKLLQDCKAVGYNTIRIWGGGYYPDEGFMNLCDEMGIVVFLDLMFACSMYNPDEKMQQSIFEEIRYNVKRLRHHASLSVISGNNEAEGMQGGQSQKIKDLYHMLFEVKFPQIIEEIAPEIPYAPSSPTSGIAGVDPNDQNFGDGHSWNVWGCSQNIQLYREQYYRYLSEFGFQSLPSMRTIEKFTEPEDRNLFSYIMERHQRCPSANNRLIRYISGAYLYPSTFSALSYASQLLQGEAMRMAVEQHRRHRGRCMGTLYWQINDVWPGATWSSIDCYGNWKALHYYAKRFYAPVLLSCEEEGYGNSKYSFDFNMNKDPFGYDYKTSARFCITNDTLNAVDCNVHWALRNSESEILESGTFNVAAEKLSATWLEELDFNKTDGYENHLEYRLEIDGKIVCTQTVLFVAPKHYHFKDPALSYRIDGDSIIVTTNSFAKNVEIDCGVDGVILEDNYFDMEKGERTIRIIEGVPQKITLRSVYDIR